MNIRIWIALILATVGGHSAELSAQPLLLNASGDDLADSQESSADQGGIPATAASQTEREAVSDKLRIAQRALASAQETSDKNDLHPPERLGREVELLKQLDVTLAQVAAAKARRADLQAQLDDLKVQLETVREVGPPEEKPYSFLLLDHLRDELAARNSRSETLQATADGAQQALTRAKEALEMRQQAARRATELEQAAADETKKAELATAVKMAELEVRLATEVLALRQQELDNESDSQQIRQAEIQLLEEKIKWMSQAVEFSRSDLQDQLVEIDKQEANVKDTLRSAEFNLEYAENELVRLRQELDASPEKQPGLVEQVEAAQLARQYHQQQVALLNSQLQRLGTVRQTWNRRFAVITESAATEDLITWGEEISVWADELSREKRLQQMRIDELRQDVANREKKLQALNGQNDEVNHWVEQQRDHLTQLIQIHDAGIVSIEGAQRLADKLRTEIQGDVQRWSLSEWLDWAGHYIGRAWNTELTKVDEHPVTIGKVVVGVLLLFVGFVLSRWLSRLLSRRLQHGRFALHESAAAAIQSLSFYALVVVSSLTALRFVNMPLTVFTFLGGAIAIGVGFGSQNILNNFISGLVLLAERPIKVGDLVQIEELYGNVEHIGARSTRIRTGNNLDIIVPNSKFLETNVVNLTLGDNKLRTQVNVGVIYGSPTREVTQLLKHAATEHGKVLNRPEPFVWFSDFGDNALIFELHFWIEARTVSDRRRIESDIRYRIDQLFRNAGLVIAFPQRDIHLDTARPLDVRVYAAPEIEDGIETSNPKAA